MQQSSTPEKKRKYSEDTTSQEEKKSRTNIGQFYQNPIQYLSSFFWQSPSSSQTKSKVYQLDEGHKLFSSVTAKTIWGQEGRLIYGNYSTLPLTKIFVNDDDQKNFCNYYRETIKTRSLKQVVELAECFRPYKPIHLSNRALEKVLRQDIHLPTPINQLIIEYDEKDFRTRLKPVLTNLKESIDNLIFMLHSRLRQSTPANPSHALVHQSLEVLITKNHTLDLMSQSLEALIQGEETFYVDKFIMHLGPHEKYAINEKTQLDAYNFIAFAFYNPIFITQRPMFYHFTEKYGNFDIPILNSIKESKGFNKTAQPITKSIRSFVAAIVRVKFNQYYSSTKYNFHIDSYIISLFRQQACRVNTDKKWPKTVTHDELSEEKSKTSIIADFKDLNIPVHQNDIRYSKNGDYIIALSMQTFQLIISTIRKERLQHILENQEAQNSILCFLGRRNRQNLNPPPEQETLARAIQKTSFVNEDEVSKLMTKILNMLKDFKQKDQSFVSTLHKLMQELESISMLPNTKRAIAKIINTAKSKPKDEHENEENENEDEENEENEDEEEDEENEEEDEDEDEDEAKEYLSPS